MKVTITSIAKRDRSSYDTIYKELIKLSSKYAKVEDNEIFPKEVVKAHTISVSASQKSYSDVLAKFQKRSYSIALHPEGKLIDSFEFSKLLSDKMSVEFFIGGAYGFEEKFLDDCDQVVSLGKLTMSHKIAKVVLLEQIYRAFTILNNHPYHK